MIRTRHVLLLLAVVFAVTATVETQAGKSTKKDEEPTLLSVADAGRLPAGKVGFLPVKCPRKYVATGGGFTTSPPGLIAGADQQDERTYGVLIYNTLPGALESVVTTKVVCIRGEFKEAKSKSSSSDGELESVLRAARREGHDVVRLGD